jgi:hypothetical protein
MLDGLDLLPYVSDAEAISFLATAREFVDTSITGLGYCVDLAPEVGTMINGLEELDASLDTLYTLY